MSAFMEDGHFVTVPPDSGWSWFVVVTTFFNNFLIEGILFNCGMFFKPLMDHFEESLTKISIVSACTVGFYFCAASFASALINHFGIRVIGVIGGLCAGGSYAITSLAPNIFVVIFTNGFLAGISLCLISISSKVIISSYFERWRGLASSISTSGSGMGIFAMPFVLRLCLNENDWKTTYYIVGGLLCLNSLLALSFRPIKPVRVKVDVLGKKKRWYSKYMYQLRSGFSETNTRRPVGPRRTSKNYPTVDQLVDPKKIIVHHDSSSDSDISMSGSTRSIDTRRSTTTNIRSQIQDHDFTLWGRYKRQFQKCLCCDKYKNQRRRCARPLYRDDIFYLASLFYTEKYEKHLTKVQKRKEKQQVDKKSIKRKAIEQALAYNMSVTRVIKDKNMDITCRCRKSFTYPIVSMLNCKLVNLPSFQLFCCIGFISHFGYIIPMIYVQERALDNQMENSEADWLISTIGISYTLGTIVSLVLPNGNKITPRAYMCSSLIICGIFTCVSGIKPCMILPVQFLYCTVYGFSSACLTSLRSVLMVNLYTMDRLTNAYGLNSVLYGFGTSLGIFCAGIARDYLDNYDISFYMSGGCLILCGCLLTFVNKLRLREIKHGHF